MVGKQRYSVSKKTAPQAYPALKIAVLSFGIILAVGIFLNVRNQSNGSAISPEIKKQIPFVIFYPGKSSGLAVKTSTVKFDSTNKILTFTATASTAAITISEQATPQSIIDIPQSYDKRIESLNEYASFNSYFDKVSLVHPKEFNGQQAAIMNSKGTVIFMHPTKGELNQDEWKKIFNGLEVIR